MQILFLDSKEDADKISILTKEEPLYSRKHPLNAQKSLWRLSILKTSLCQPLGKAIIHLEKDKAACDGGVSIKLAMWTDGFD